MCARTADELGDDDADRMEFYVNHLSSECADASRPASQEELLSDGQHRHQEREHERYDSHNDEEDDDRDKYYYRPRLAAVPEETDEDLARYRGDESGSCSLAGSDDSADATSFSSEQWKWGNGWLNTSDDDSSTVIDVPLGEFPPAPYQLTGKHCADY